MNIFEFNDYKEFVNARIRAKTNKGRGELQRIAEALAIHPTLVSHIFRGSKDLSLEQSSRLCIYLELSPIETDYFLLLLQRAKSGSVELSKIFDRQLSALRKKSKSLINRVATDKTLNEEDRAIFYSNWYYSAIRLLTSISGLDTRQKIQERTGLPMPLVQGVLEFLALKGLCNFDGVNYSMGPALTHLEANSNFISQHHLNWRLKAIENHPQLNEEDLVFSGPLTISSSDAPRVREKLIALIKEVGSIVTHSPGERLYCFNIDWVNILKP